MCYNILNIIQAGKSMTLQQLKYIVTVAQTGTITEAAGKLYISQPSLTNAIHELEKEMNITIFNRTNKGISVSKEGEEFLSYARQILDQAAILEDKYKGDMVEESNIVYQHSITLLLSMHLLILLSSSDRTNMISA